MNEEEVLVGRIQDLAEQCYHRDVPSHTEFLTLAEQDLFYRTVNKILGVRYVLSGGYEAAERKEGSVASVRLDAVLSLAFSSSRSKMVPLIEGGQVFINGKLVTSPSASLKEDDLVTVRHMGKFRYVGVQNQTKKGRLYVAVERFVS